MKKKITESVEENKFIPTGKEFTNLFNLYKTVRSEYLDGYKKAFDRKLSDGYNGRGNNYYGDGAYLTFNLESAKGLLGGYGDCILQVKLLGGFENFVFFNGDSDYFIKDLQVKTYGKELNPKEQLIAITGDKNIEQNLLSELNKRSPRGYHSYIRWDSSTFGTQYLRILHRMGYCIRGLVYRWSGVPVAQPFDFGSVITCAAASGLSRYDSVDDIKRKMHGVLDDKSRKTQSEWMDVVLQLEMLDAKNENALYTRCFINNKTYAPYENYYGGKYNLVELDDENMSHPKPKFVIPSYIKVQELPDLPDSESGVFSFNSDGERWYATVCHEIAKIPALWSEEFDDWIPFENYQDALKARKDAKSGQFQNENPETDIEGEEQDKFVAESALLNEAFNPEMSKDEFLSQNKCHVYVCAHADSVKAIFKNGFSRQFANANDYMHNGGALTYGDGQYGSVSFENARDNLSKKRDYGKSDGYKYGNVILKCVLLGGWNRFLIFDEKLAKAVYKDKWQILDQVDIIVKDDSARQELKQYIGRFLGTELYNPSNDSMRRTNHVLFNMFGNRGGFEKWTTFFRKNGIRGGVYHGHGDGYCFVCYNFSEVIPISATYDDGQTWTDKFFDYETTRRRLSFDNDPKNKFGHLFKSMSPYSMSVTCNGKTFGVTNVETKNGKFNLLINNIGKKVSPYDFDIEPTISPEGVIEFKYRGYDLQGILVHETAEIPAFWFDPFESWYSFGDLNEVINEYENQASGEESIQNYEIQDDSIDNQQLQESFFRFLDKMELL